MEQQKVDMFIMANGQYLPEQKIPYVRETLLNMDETKWSTLSTIQFKSPTTTNSINISRRLWYRPFLPRTNGYGCRQITYVWWLIRMDNH